ncbi:MAG: LAGLIDADG family homing endonuclease [Candidatus Paceibacterota bacterium]
MKNQARYFFSPKDLFQVFTSLREKSGLPWSLIAEKLSISSRQLSSYKKGQTTIPESLTAKIKSHYDISFPVPIKSILENEMKSDSARLGGKERMRLHGSFGTLKSRQKGGFASVKVQAHTKDSHFVQRFVKTPRKSKRLAELAGILLGDGGVTKRQITITLHRKDDFEYSQYVFNLMKSVFCCSVTAFHIKNVINIRISRTMAVNCLSKLGIHACNKVKKQVDVPNWIKDNATFSTHCVRGLFDTDGCVHVDRRKIKEKDYANVGLYFSNRSLPLLNFVYGQLVLLGFAPRKYKYAVLVRREKDVIGYMRLIGTSNPKHKGKFENFFKVKYGGVA